MPAALSRKKVLKPGQVQGGFTMAGMRGPAPQRHGRRRPAIHVLLLDAGNEDVGGAARSPGQARGHEPRYDDEASGPL